MRHLCIEEVENGYVCVLHDDTRADAFTPHRPVERIAANLLEVEAMLERHFKTGPGDHVHES